MTISAKTQVCAVIGDPVGHSMSPQIHNAAFQALGLDFVYVACPVKRGDARAAVHGMRSLGLKGMSVTIPHKCDVIPHLDAIDPVAEKLGSVNTIVNVDGRLTGYSTDGPGAMRALETAGVAPAGKAVLMLGSGGAARALAFTLAVLSPAPSLEILGIEAEELARLASDVEAKTGLTVKQAAFTPDALKAAMERAEVVIHASPVGMSPKVDATLVPSGLIRSGQAVFDVVYNPVETRLLREAGEAGAVTVSGLGMFVHQAAIQFELWTGRDAPLAVMEENVKAALGK